MMKKERLKGWLGLFGTLLLLFYMGGVYRQGGFDAGFGLILLAGILAVPAVLLASYRRVGSLPAWFTAVAAFPTLYIATRDTATAVLAWTLTVATPLAVTLFWPYYKKLLPLTAHALPLSGALWLGGTLVYSKLHFGSWSLYAVTERIAFRYTGMVDEMEALYERIYQEQLPAQFEEMFTLLRSQSLTMGFYLVMMASFALLGAYFLGIFVADRAVKNASGWLGSWRTIIPGRGISWFFMLSYILIQFTAGPRTVAVMAVIYFFGFFFVFTGIYWIRGLMKKKNWPALAQKLLVGLLLILSYCTVGGALLSPYTILLYLGWWIATLPKKGSIQA